MILLTAAAAKTGRAVVAACARSGLRVRALVRRDVEVAGATEVVRGDLGDLGPHLDGIEAVYFIWPNFTPGEPEGVQRALAACRAAGVGRFVYHSVLHPHVAVMPHHWWKAEAEAVLFDAGVSFVSLQPGAYVQNVGLQLDSIRGEGVYRSPWGLDAPMSLVDLDDVATVAARACVDDGMVGGCYELAGPEALAATDVAAALATAFGRPVDAIDIGSEGWAASARAAGLDDVAVDCGVRMADQYRAHGFTGSSFVLEALLGRPPTVFADYATRLALEAT